MKSNELQITLAKAKQQYDELLNLTSLNALAAVEFGEGAQKERIHELLKNLYGAVSSVERTFNEHITESGESPIFTLPAAHVSFYRDVLRPNWHTIRAAYLEISGLAMLVKDLEKEEDTTSNAIHNAMTWGLQRWIDMLDQNEEEDWWARGFDLQAARDLCEMPWFKPDTWVDNFKKLEPVLLDKPANHIRNHVRDRLTEIYQSFGFGLWMGAIALCRSMVEFSVKDNAPRLGFAVIKGSRSGQGEEKTLSELSSELVKFFPALAEPLEIVRDSGNRILHPKKRHVIAFPHVQRQEALKCIEASRFITETLYSLPKQ
jgi:hypothetical protein